MFNLKSCLVAFCVALPASAFSDDREKTLCGWFQERFMFQIWSTLAPSPDESRVAGNDLIQKVEFTTADGKTLKGYKYQSQDENGLVIHPKGYLLMALGNAMIADQTIHHLALFSQRGYDAYIFDYRGYGDSQGKRRINAFIQDYIELVSHLNTQYEKHALYGVSLGGAVIANVIGAGAQYDRAVIDSSPSRFSPYGCPKRIDPSENVPTDATNLLVITGAEDSVLGPDMTTEFRKLAELNGATVVDGPDYDHPFKDRTIDIHKERLNRIVNFIDNSERN